MEVEIRITKNEIKLFIEALKLHEGDLDAQERDISYIIFTLRQRVYKEISRGRTRVDKFHMKQLYF